MKKGILFDLDGTLLDTAGDFVYFLNTLLGEYGRPALPFEIIRQSVSKGANGLVQLGFQITPNASDFEEKKKRLLDLYEESLGDKTTFFEGIESLLEQLNQKDLPWGIVTNKPKRFTDPLIKKFKYLDNTPCVVSGDTLEKSKPHPLPILHAVEKLNLSPQHSLYVGDDLRDVQAASASQMPSCVVLYGYRLPEEDPSTWGASQIVSHAHDIYPVFEKLTS